MKRDIKRMTGRAGLLLVMMVLLTMPALAEPRSAQTWGIGWDDGLTVRRWLGDSWELSVAAGPNDYLVKIESQTWNLRDPSQQHGTLEVPEDHRQEEGWVRAQVGHLVTRRGDFALVGYSGLVYSWNDYQERALVLNHLVGDYDTWELDRFTERWVLTLGIRPSWRPVDFMTVELAVGLNFVWESWEQTTEQSYAGVGGSDQSADSGHSRSFEDFGWEGASSLQFFFWF